MSPPITAWGVFKNAPLLVMPTASLSPTRWNVSKNHSTGPLCPRIVCHAMVRIRNDVKNGTMIRPNSSARYFPALKAKKYASG